MRRADLMFGTAWRAAPLLATTCVLVAVVASVFLLGYPLGFRAIVDGAVHHQAGQIVAGLIIVTVTFPMGWALQLAGGALNSRLTDVANLRVGIMTLGDGVGAGDLPRIDDRGAVRDAIARAGADGMIDGDGLDTLLGPYIGGRSLSGGQWQRLALARGLMREHPLLIVLDEPTASLDAPSEAALFERYRDAARRLGETNGSVTVLVSHRFSTVHMADMILVLDGGTVSESGDHATLMARGGSYAELFGLQAAGYQ